MRGELGEQFREGLRCCGGGGVDDGEKCRINHIRDYVEYKINVNTILKIYVIRKNN